MSDPGVIANAIIHTGPGTAQVLIFDPDSAGIGPLCTELEKSGFVVSATSDREAAMAAIARRPPQLVIADWDLPGYGGLELIEAVRRADPPGGIALIILSAQSGEHDVVRALDLGADDYVVRPFAPREMAARARAVLRTRARRHHSPTPHPDDLILDAATTSVTARRRSISLGPVEYRLLAFLVRHPGKAFRRRQLLMEVWGPGSVLDERTVDVNVQRLRKLLAEPGCQSYIQTVRGFGYRFVAPLAH